MKNKKLLIGLGAATVIIGTYLGYRYYQNTPATKAQFDRVVGVFAMNAKKGGVAIDLKDVPKDWYKTTLDRFTKNLSKKEANELFSLTYYIFSQNSNDIATDQVLKARNRAYNLIDKVA